jgi:hypothetical protein
LKLKLHAAKAGGVYGVVNWVRLKLKLHAAKAGGVSSKKTPEKLGPVLESRIESAHQSINAFRIKEASPP